jgi:uncharacterized protein YxjI
MGDEGQDDGSEALPPSLGVPAAASGRAGRWGAPKGASDRERVVDQVTRQAGVERREGGGGTLFTEPVLVVNQKAKIIELTNEYSVFDQDGRRIGSVAEVGQSAVKKIARFVSSLDQFMTHTYEIRDADERCVLTLTRPRKIVKSSFVISRADGTELGVVKQANVFGKIRFSLESGGQTIGSLNAENWRAWDFHVKDSSDLEVARVTKTFGGFLKAGFTTADNYVVQLEPTLVDPLRSMVVAAALCVDTALKQDARGLG